MYVSKNPKIGIPLRAVVVLMLFFFAFLIALLDFASKGELGLSIFMIFFPVFAVWGVGILAGIVTSIFCASLWTGLAFHLYGFKLVTFTPYINFSIHTLVLLLITDLTYRVKVGFDLQNSLVRQDTLTGVSNGQAFYEQATQELDKAKRNFRALSAIAISCNNFKEINLELGYESGDKLLCLIAENLSKILRQSDTCARFAGDEFMILLPETDFNAVALIIKRINLSLECLKVYKDREVIFSIGALTFDQFPESADDLIRLVDGQMLDIKKTGKSGIKHNCYIPSES